MTNDRVLTISQRKELYDALDRLFDLDKPDEIMFNVRECFQQVYNFYHQTRINLQEDPENPYTKGMQVAYLSCLQVIREGLKR